MSVYAVSGDKILTIYELSQILGLSEDEVNGLLEKLGFQRMNERGEWEITEAGEMYGVMVPVQ